jgi:hypothetical protein
MAYLAVRDYTDRSLTFRFVSNIDPTDLAEATHDLGPGQDAVHRLLQDVHNAGDGRQRHRGPPLVPRPARRRRAGGGPAFRRGVDERRESQRVRH